MATRAYRRDNHGRFAGTGGGTKVTYGRAGGFANAAFRARVSSARASGSARNPNSNGNRSRHHLSSKAKQRLIVGGVGLAAAGGAAYAISRRSSGGGRGGIIKNNPLTPNSPRSEAIPMVGGRNGVSMREAVKAAATGPKPRVTPNYSAAKGTREYVGRRVTDGNYGLKLQAGPIVGKKYSTYSPTARAARPGR